MKIRLFIEVVLDSVVTTFQEEKVQVEIRNFDWLERSKWSSVEAASLEFEVLVLFPKVAKTMLGHFLEKIDLKFCGLKFLNFVNVIAKTFSKTKSKNRIDFLWK